MCRGRMRKLKAAMAGATPAPPLSFTLTVPFPSCLEAQIAHDTLAPDAEPRRGGITKQLSVNRNILRVQWQADEARILRVSVSSFLDLLSLAIQTMDRFGPPLSEQ